MLPANMSFIGVSTVTTRREHCGSYSTWCRLQLIQVRTTLPDIISMILVVCSKLSGCIDFKHAC